MAKLVTVALNRAYTWQESAETPEKSYGPGTVQVPLVLAQRLQDRHVITDWTEYSGENPQSDPEVDRILPSQELAPDFPAREYLFMSGHTTYKHVSELTREQLVALPGIGEAKADAILGAVADAAKLMPARDGASRMVSVQPNPAQSPVTETPRRGNVRRAAEKSTQSTEANDGPHTDAE